jgi:isoleucyl-tRNA synthetase
MNQVKKRIIKIGNRVNFPDLEQEIHNFWQENNIFQKSIDNRASADKYTFIDGPPFVTGTPHYGSLLPSIAKDLIPRFKTMQGYQVRRVFGWDCHGLPIEEKVSKKLNLKGSVEIENYGIDKYISECRLYIKECTDSWQWYIDKVGRWVDTKNAYYTMKPEFNESVLWLFKQAWDKKIVYKGKRVSLYSTDNNTPVSDFEVSMDPSNYRDVTDTSITVKFGVKGSFKDIENLNILAWTTTPWTMPAHCAIAVNEKLEYVIVQVLSEEDESKITNYLVAKNLVENIFEKMNYQILSSVIGSELVGLAYEPPFNFYPELTTDNHFKIYPADFVTDTDGTGFVHLATYGKDDYELFQKYKITPFDSIDKYGNMLVGETFKGLYLRHAKKRIIAELQEKGKLFTASDLVHRLPFYRGDNPLIYFPQDSYFIDIQSIKPRMLELNEQINWYPKHLKQGRFLDIIKNSPDWCISRNRYWATIMPLWIAEDESDQIVCGSIEEMADYCTDLKKNVAGKWLFKDHEVWLHRDICDQIVLIKDGKKYNRVKEVLDNWLDSGSVPFAEYHYPFENKEAFEQNYPADFITEYVGQLRAWYNILLRVGVIGFDNLPFKNAITTGNIAGNDGRKMSKSFGNYSDPKETLEKIGGEALRLYLMGSSVMNGEDMSWSDATLNDQVKNILIPFWNTYSYFTIYAELSNFAPINDNFVSQKPLDKWVESITNQAIIDYTNNLEIYDIPASVKIIQPTIDAISTWWIRRSRERFAELDLDAIQTLYAVLSRITRLFAPQLPFITEKIYGNIIKDILPNSFESVHLDSYPKAGEVDQSLITIMSTIQDLCSLGLKVRADSGIKLRQPLASATLNYKAGLEISVELLDIVKNELNVKQIIIGQSRDELSVSLDTVLTKELEDEGVYREIARQIQAARKNAGLNFGELVEMQFFSEEGVLISFVTSKKAELMKELYLSDISILNSQSEELALGKVDGQKIYLGFKK